MTNNHINPALEAELSYRREQLLASRRSHNGPVPWFPRRRRRTVS